MTYTGPAPSLRTFAIALEAVAQLATAALAQIADPPGQVRPGETPQR